MSGMKKMIMAFSALLLGVTGIAFSFLPVEILNYAGTSSNTFPRLLLQLIGALYFAFAMLNWMSKGSHLGGIYNRPIVVANLTHFFVAGLALLKLLSSSRLPVVYWIPVIVYVIFALLFTWILFSDPISDNEKD